MHRPIPRRTALRGLAVAAGGTVAAPLTGCTDDPSGPGPSGPGTSTGSAGPTGGGTAPTSPSSTGTPSAPGPHELVVHDDDRVTLLDPDAEPTTAAAAALLARCTAVVVVAAGSPTGAAARTARRLGLPLLVDGPGLRPELDRLGTRTVVVVGGTGDAASGPDVGDRDVVLASAATPPVVDGLPATRPEGRVLLVEAPTGRAPSVLRPLLDAVGASRRRLGSTDPRAGGDDATWLRRRREAVVLGVGPLGGHFPQRVRTVRRAPTLAGGGWVPFPRRRMVALYGHPQTSALGLLGEQGPQASVARARRYAGDHARASGDLVVPAFELIATVAAGSAGPDGTYSRRTAVGVLRPWVDAAREGGVYVVLDLQPGRADFLDQAKAYEELLREPHVGLALDPEWRLGRKEKPLERIGHVGVAEVNRVGRWLAELVREHDLPPKVLTVHQFRTSMVRDRDDLDTDLDEVQWLVHADGQGAQGAKQGTWDAVRADLPDGVFLGWKNFVDEDRPMLTPEQTEEQVRPVPSFVSYQ